MFYPCELFIMKMDTFAFDERFQCYNYASYIFTIFATVIQKTKLTAFNIHLKRIHQLMPKLFYKKMGNMFIYLKFHFMNK